MAKESPPNSHSNTEDHPQGGKTSFPIVSLLNIIALLGSIGLFYYSKFVFKRPSITETGEREKLEKIYSTPPTPTIASLIPFEPITINISASSNNSSPTGKIPPGAQKRIHYATIGFALEIRDSSKKDLFESLKPFILDQVNILLGKKQFQELNNVHGRYLFRSQLIDMANHIVTTKTTLHLKDDLVTNAYFTQFVIQ